MMFSIIKMLFIRVLWKYIMKKKLKSLFFGLIIGVVNGFFGSAGGILAVETMEHEKIDEKKAHATALFVIFPITVLSSFLYIRAGYFLMDVFIYTGIGAAAGGIAGAVFLKKANTAFINQLFTMVIFITGIRMLF